MDDGIAGKMDESRKILLYYLLNQLWRARNLFVFEGKIGNIEEEVSKAVSGWDEFWSLQDRKREAHITRTGQVHRDKWEASPTNQYKINVDASTKGTINGGIGAMIRDELGSTIAAATWPISFALQAHEAEVLAAFFGIKLYKGMLLKGGNPGM
ncbi:hypothetical protein PIB30_073911 [Stylosanthes scabra]|uniref:RNase H type-1 domain-containing protein n=1 Tax=Stylosanthes scabra TaxID=79078 RepID=A0ABU6UN93_9FABA|nr:hypothetical protein [Stylosanthes scabra]